MSFESYTVQVKKADVQMNTKFCHILSINAADQNNLC